MKKRFRFGVKGRFIISFNWCFVARDIKESEFNDYTSWLATVGLTDGMKNGPATVYITWT